MMILSLFVLLVLFALGASIGSFLNVVIDRLPKGKPVIKSRSICDYCRKVLCLKDLIPLLSYVFLRGKCRFCGKGIDPRLPVVELTSGVVFLAIGIYSVSRMGGALDLIYYLLIASVFIVIFFMDLKYKIIEDKVVLFGVITSLLYLFISKGLRLYNMYLDLTSSSFGKYLISAGLMKREILWELRNTFYILLTALVLFLFFYFLVFITKGRSMGGGDVKFAFLIGLVAGFPNAIISIFISFLTGALVGIILILLGIKTIKSAVPFGPFLVFGTAMGMLFGEEILRWYMGLPR